MPEAEAQPSLGRCEYRLAKPAPGAAPVHGCIVTYENRTLEARREPKDDYVQTFALSRVGPDIFTLGIYDDHGTVSEVLRPDMTFTFRRVAGQPVTFTVRLDDDTLEATGTRKPYFRRTGRDPALWCGGVRAGELTPPSFAFSRADRRHHHLLHHHHHHHHHHHRPA